MFDDDPISIRYGARKSAAFESARRLARQRLYAEGYSILEVERASRLLQEKRIFTACPTTLYKVCRALVDGARQSQRNTPTDRGATSWSRTATRYAARLLSTIAQGLDGVPLHGTWREPWAAQRHPEPTPRVFRAK